MNNVKKIILHPLFIVMLFCVIVISGETMGGCYLFYLLIGIPHLALHAVLGVLSIFLLLISGYTKRNKLLNIIGAVLAITSLVYFFEQPGCAYNYNTFHEFLPLLSIILFGFVVVVFLWGNIKK